jgi:hypothetical protein
MPDLREYGVDDSSETDITTEAHAFFDAKLLNAPLATEPKSFNEAPPLASYADYEGRRYPVLDPTGSVDSQLLWGSHILASKELPEAHPTRQLLTKMAQKFHIGIYNDEWKKTPPAASFLLSKQFALETVRRFRETFSPTSQPADSPTTPVDESDSEPMRPITIRVTKETDVMSFKGSAIIELEELQNRTRFNSINARGNPGVFAAGYKEGVADAIKILRSPVYVREPKL